MMQGIAFLKENHPAKAVDSFQKAVELQPDNVGGWVNLSTSCIAAGNFSLAVEAAKKAIAISPTLAPAYMMLGDAERESNNHQAAFFAYKKAVDLDRNPLALNKFGCAVRERKLFDQAESLFKEAMSKAPQFATAQINLLTTYMLQENFHSARDVSIQIDAEKFPPLEKNKFFESVSLIDEFFRLAPDLKALEEGDDRGALRDAIAKPLPETFAIDEELSQVVEQLACSARSITSHESKERWTPPAAWPEIEGLFMIPLIDSAQDYLDYTCNRLLSEYTQEQHQASLNMAEVIRRIRRDRDKLADPIAAEISLRHWHIEATRLLDGYLPGHFKYSENLIGSDKEVATSTPVQTVLTLRNFIARHYQQLSPGLPRAALVLFVIAHVHPFPDGNGRIAQAWLNRELEWAGLPVAIFTRPMGFLGELGIALKAVRRQPGNIMPLVKAIQSGQTLCLKVCKDLER
ncbi:MAG TPA: tetratricopeptide repeat protein [Cellvibrionaceae bacterium]